MISIDMIAYIAVNKCEYLKNYDKEFKLKYHMCELQIENKFK